MTNAKIQYLMHEINNYKITLDIINQWLEFKKAMSYEEWRGSHMLIDLLEEQIELNEEEIQEEFKKGRGQ